MPERPPLRVLLAVGLVAACTLALQVLLTRLFAAVLFYHFAFLAISLALLGTGAGAILIYVRPAWFDRADTEGLLARWCVVLAALLLVVPALLVRLDYTAPPYEVGAGFVVVLAFAAVLATLPFLAAGIVIALAIRRYIRSVHRVYAFDLAGAGVGAVATVPLLWLVDAPLLLVGLGAAAAIAALLFAGRRSSARRVAGGAALAAGVLVLLGATTNLYYLPAPFEDEGEPIGGRFTERTPVGDTWTPISRVVGYPRERTHVPGVTYDRDYAPVPLRRPGDRYPDWRKLELGPQSVGYELTGPGDALIIGGGGGRDIYNALSSGQRRVDVIELNRAIRRIVDEDLRSSSGSPYSLPRVSYAIGDGRSTLAARERKYDQVHIGFTNTLTASAGHTYALSENNLYTVEAFDEYLDHLRPGGVLNVSRPRWFTGDEALRATVLSLEALERRGIREPERHVAVVLGESNAGFFGTVLTRLEPYTPRELATIRRLGEERGGGVAFAPGGPYRLEWRRLAAADGHDEFCEGYRFDVCAPTDDRPFFFNSTRLTGFAEPPTAGSPFLSRTPFLVLLAVLGILMALSAAAFALPLAVVRNAGRPAVSSLSFFAAIGLGFLLLEIVLVQQFVLFLGFPTYALSVVVFSLLVFTGIGARLSGRWERPRKPLLVALGAACALIAAAAVGLAPLLRELIDLPFAARVAITVAMLAPLGLSLGMAMPIGLGRLSGLYPTGVPWAWGINGITSVLAAVLAVFVGIVWGFTVATLLALGCYLAALGHAALGRWPSATATAGSPG